jgi:16S rRNA (cytosine967-C5)-methyltransferase
VRKFWEKNLDRLGVKNVRIEIIDANEFEGETFDRVLVDAPCSGIGTLTKKPDIKWKRDLGDIRKLSEIQYQLLEKGASLLKPNGVVVYSTCTIEPEENVEVVNKFLSNHNNFSLVNAKEEFDASVIDINGCVQTMPNVNGIDGAFAAKIVRNS